MTTLLEGNVEWETWSPHSRTSVGIHLRIYWGRSPPKPPPGTPAGIRSGSFPTCRSCEGNTNLTTSYMCIIKTIKEKLHAKRLRARALAGKCSCKTCYNSIFNNYIAKSSDINIIYDFVLAEKTSPPNKNA